MILGIIVTPKCCLFQACLPLKLHLNHKCWRLILPPRKRSSAFFGSLPCVFKILAVEKFFLTSVSNGLREINDTLGYFGLFRFQNLAGCLEQVLDFYFSLGFRFPETFWNGWRDKCLPSVFWYLPGNSEGKWDVGSGCGVSQAVLSFHFIHCSERCLPFLIVWVKLPHHSILVPLIFSFKKHWSLPDIISHIVIYLWLFSRRGHALREWGLVHTSSPPTWCASESPGGLVKTRSSGAAPRGCSSVDLRWSLSKFEFLTRSHVILMLLALVPHLGNQGSVFRQHVPACGIVNTPWVLVGWMNEWMNEWMREWALVGR